MKRLVVLGIFLFTFILPVAGQWKDIGIDSNNYNTAAGVYEGNIVYFDGGIDSLDLTTLSEESITVHPDYDLTSYTDPNILELLPSRLAIKLASGIILGDSFYLFGGRGNNPENNFEQSMVNFNSAYNFSTDTWTDLAERPVTATNSAIAAWNNKIYLVGGKIIESQLYFNGLRTEIVIEKTVTYTTEIDCYDIETDSWRNVTNVPEANLAMAAMTIYNDKMYLFGGYYTDTDEISREIMAFDLIEEIWTRQVGIIPEEHARIFQHGGNILDVVDGKVYFAGGKEFVKSTLEACDKFSIYDINSDTWTSLDPLPKPRSNHNMVISDDIITLFNGVTEHDYLDLPIFVYSLDLRADVDTMGRYTNLHSSYNSATNECAYDDIDHLYGLQSVYKYINPFDYVDTDCHYTDTVKGEFLEVYEYESDIPEVLTGNHLALGTVYSTEDGSQFYHSLMIQNGNIVDKELFYGSYSVFGHSYWETDNNILHSRSCTGSLTLKSKYRIDFNALYSDSSTIRDDKEMAWFTGSSNFKDSLFVEDSLDINNSQSYRMNIGKNGVLVYNRNENNYDYNSDNAPYDMYWLLIQKSRGMKTPDIAGTWYYQNYLTENAGGDVSIAKGIMTIDTKGNFQIDLDQEKNIDGVYSTDEIHESGTIELKSDGTFTIPFNGTELFGAVNPTTEMIVIDQTDANDVGLGIGLKAFDYSVTDYNDFDLLPLELDILSCKTPEFIFQGDDEKLKFKVGLTNAARDTLLPETEVTLTAYAVNQETLEEFVLGVEQISLKKLKRAKTKKVSLKINNTTGLPTGTYDFRFECNGVSRTTEEQDAMRVELPYVDYACTITADNFPTEFAYEYDYDVQAKFELDTTNIGNIPTDKKAECLVEFYAQSDTSDSLLIGFGTGKIGNLKPGKAKTLKFTCNYPAHLPKDEYTLFAQATYSYNDEDGGTIETTVDIPEFLTFNVAEAYEDISGAIDKPKVASLVIPGSKDGHFKLPVTVTNSGNVPFEKGSSLAFEAMLYGNEDYISIGDLSKASISKLQVGETKKFNIPVDIPQKIEQGEYWFVTNFDVNNTVGNEELDSDTYFSNEPIDVAGGFMAMTEFEGYDVITYLSKVSEDYIIPDDVLDLTEVSADSKFNVEVEISSGTVSEYYYDYDTSDLLKINQYIYNDQDNKVYLDEYSSITGAAEFYLYFDNLDILASKDSADIYGEMITSEYTIIFSGKATSKNRTTLSKVTYLNQTYDAIKYTYSISVPMTGQYDGLDVPFVVSYKLKLTNSFWVIPNVGVVKSKTVNDENISYKAKATVELTEEDQEFLDSLDFKGTSSEVRIRNY